MDRITLICGDGFDDIMTAVYDAWGFMKKGYSVSIWAGENCEYSLFSGYVTVEADIGKSLKVSQSIRRKISEQAFLWVYRAAMHFDHDRANAILGFLKAGYKMGSGVTDCLDNIYVMRIMELNRKVTNEAHRFRGFVRFSEVYRGLLYSEIRPKCDVITLIAPHFDNRFPMENWIIYDKSRRKAAVHKSGDTWVIVSDYEFCVAEFKNSGIIDSSTKRYNDNFEELWKVFFKAISIESRANPNCQQNLVPLWYRENMLEFGDKNRWKN